MYKGWRGWWEAEGGLHLPLGHRQWCCVFSKGQKQGHNPQDRQRWSLEAVWHHPDVY